MLRSDNNLALMEDALINTGISILNPNAADEPRTVIVVGYARGGTSIVAGALSALGVFMGSKVRVPVYEDALLANAFESNDEARMEEIIAEYDATHRVWGFKRPSVLNYLPMVHSKVRNPRYIFIFRDALSIATRNSISMQADVLSTMREALNGYLKATDFIQEYNPASMLISSEKLLQNKHDFILQLCDFVGLQPTAEAMKQAENFIAPNPLLYLDNTRITKAIGGIKKITAKSLRGWAKLVHQDRPPSIDVYVNDNLIAELVPDDYRPELVDHKLHEAGYAGFEIKFQEELKAGDVVRIRAKDDIRDICVYQFRGKAKLHRRIIRAMKGLTQLFAFCYSFPLEEEFARDILFLALCDL